ncbi:MAG: hypothetical protein C4292_06285 [Nitrososphaera sp.]
MEAAMCMRINSMSRQGSAITPVLGRLVTKHLTIRAIGGCEMQKKMATKYIFLGSIKKVDYISI